MLVALVSEDTATGGSLIELFVLIGLVVVIMVGVLIYRIRSSKGAAKTGQAAQMAALRRHHTPLWSSGNQRSFRPEPVHWGLAVAAPFSLCSDEPWDRVRDDDMEGVRRELAASWRIQGRLTMLRAMYNLLTTGSREEYVREIARWLAMDVKEAASFERMLRGHARNNADSARMLWQFRRVRTNARDITQANFLAWDFVRAAMLARAGATAGYLSEAEAEDFFYMIADELRRQYSSWKNWESPSCLHTGSGVRPLATPNASSTCMTGAARRRCLAVRGASFRGICALRPLGCSLRMRSPKTPRCFTSSGNRTPLMVRSGRPG